MTIGIVEQRLDTVLNADHPKVLLLTGGWGAGKTYQWKLALQRAAAAGKKQSYAYVSLFGLTSLAEVRKRVIEETFTTIQLPGSNRSLGDEIVDAGWRFKPLQIMKLLPVIPYLGKLEGLANELAFTSVRNTVVCFDDLERGGIDLRLSDIFGLASFLKEERNCRIVLISNHKKLDSKDQDDLFRYAEKVVDEIVHFAPTSNEACKIALGDAPDLARSLLRERINELGISNIRVISRLSNMAAEMAILFDRLHEQVLRDAVHSLALFGAAQFLPTDGFPSMDYLMQRGTDWSHFLRNRKSVEDETDEDRKQASWDKLLDRYKYTDTSPFDSEIGRAVQQGYFDTSKLLPLAQDQSDSFEMQRKRTDYYAAWGKFWHSLNGSGADLLNELHGITIRAMEFIGPGDVQLAYSVFSQAGNPTVAEELLELFIAKNQHKPGVFAQVDGSFSNQFSGEFAVRLRAEYERHKVESSIEDALDRIDLDSGWNSEDVRVVGKANSQEIEKLLRASEGARFRARLTTLLRIGKLQGAKDDEKRVSQLTLELLQKLAGEDSIMSIRMRQYMPTDAVD